MTHEERYENIITRLDSIKQNVRELELEVVEDAAKCNLCTLKFLLFLNLIGTLTVLVFK